MTVGETADPAALGPLPAHVRAERWIPQAEVFAEADAMVGHGGFGTTMGALLAGVPQVVVPLFADQPYNAARVADLGAGLAAGRRRACAPPSSGCSPSRPSASPRAGSRSRPRGCPRSTTAPAALEALAARARARERPAAG